MKLIQNHLEELEYISTPDYELIHRVFDAIRNRLKVTSKEPFDWEKGGRFYSEFMEIEDSSSVRSSTTSISSDSTGPTMSRTRSQEDSDVTTEADTEWDTSWEELDASIEEEQSDESEVCFLLF